MQQLSETVPRDDVAAIREAFRAQRGQGRVRHREVADSLGLSEGELVAAHIGHAIGADGQHGLTATRLRAEWVDIVAALESLGEVMRKEEMKA